MTLRIRTLRFVCLSTALLISHSAWSASMLRVVCSGDSARAEISVNGQFKGECPLDMEIKPGDVRVRAVKAQDIEVERVFEENFRLGDGVIKRIEILLGKPQYTAEGMRRLQARKLAEEETARRAAAEKERARLQKVAEEEQARRQQQEKLAAGMAALQAQGVEPGNGKSFQDCPDCPSMVMIPRTEGVTSPPAQGPAAISQYEITRGEYARFVNETRRPTEPGCMVWIGGMFKERLTGWGYLADRNWTNPGFEQTDAHPVVCVSMTDAEDYAKWLSAKTGYRYKLPAIDWWYAAAGLPARPSATGMPPVFTPWRDKSEPLRDNSEEACRYGNFYDQSGHAVAGRGLAVPGGKPYPCNDKFQFTAPVGSFPAGPMGIFDLFGNVTEWLADGADKSHVVYSLGDSWSSADFGKLIGPQPRFKTHRQQDLGFRVMRGL